MFSVWNGVAERLGLRDPGSRQVALAGTVAQAAGIDLVLIGGRVPQIDHLAPVLHGGDEDLGLALRRGRTRADEAEDRCEQNAILQVAHWRASRRSPP